MLQKHRVVVFYGGDAATHPRDELLAWLRGPYVGVEARIVAESSPHTGGAIDDRVSATIAWADAAIALVTPDPRTGNSVPLNVADEIGRWREKKGKNTLCLVRQQGVELHSNLDGIVYVEFEKRIREAFESIRHFLMDLPGTETVSATPSVGSVHEIVIDATPNLLLLDGRLFRFSDLTQAGDAITVSLPGLGGQAESVLRQLERARKPVEMAYGNIGTVVEIKQCVFSHGEGTASAKLTLRDTRREYGGGVTEAAWGGSPQLSADEIAELRASRILFNDPPPIKDTVGLESLIRGLGDRAKVITQSPIESILAQLPRDARETWETLYLVLVLYLRLSDCVENVELLRLTARSGKLARVEFQGTRRQRYANQAAHVIKFDRKL